MTSFPWDKSQTPKKDFNYLRFSLGSVIEFVFADLFHGSLEMGKTKHRRSRVGMGFPSAYCTFGI